MFEMPEYPGMSEDRHERNSKSTEGFDTHTHTHTHTHAERERERPLEDVQMFEDYGKEYMAYW